MNRPQKALLLALIAVLMIVLLMRGAHVVAGAMALLLFLGRVAQWGARLIQMRNIYYQYKYHAGQGRGTKANQSGMKMPVDEAKEVLGIEGELSKEVIKKAYQEMMKRNHPDHGGSKYLAAMINAARDTLIEQLGEKK